MEMKGFIGRFSKLAMGSLMLPFFCGCGGGGVALLGSLFGAGTTAGAVASTSALEGGTLALASAAIPATIHNPEPATMLLLGGGVVVLGLLNRKRK